MLGLITFVAASAIFIAAPTGASSISGNQDFQWRNYPPGALAKGEGGKVGFSIVLTDRGSIEKCAVTESSGYATLDRETCDFIVRYAHFGTVRDTAGKSQRATKTGFISWTLPPGITKSAAPKMASITLPPPLVCKRTRVTGSRVENVTYCRTDKEWNQHDRLTREKAERLVGPVFCGDHGCE